MYTFFERSASSIIDMILENLFNYIEFENPKFSSLGNQYVNDELSSWLDWFDDYQNNFLDEEKEFIEREIGEFLGDKDIWFEELEDILNVKQTMFNYFGVENGFYKLIVNIYDEMLKDD